MAAWCCPGAADTVCPCSRELETGAHYCPCDGQPSYQFLTCVNITAHIIDIGWMSVRPSVRPSVTRWYCVETAQPIVKLSPLPGSLMILVF